MASITITGTVLSLSDKAAREAGIIITPSAEVYDPVSDLVYTADPRYVDTDPETGQFSITLLAPTSGVHSPETWTYTVAPAFARRPFRSVTIRPYPDADATVDIADALDAPIIDPDDPPEPERTTLAEAIEALDVRVTVLEWGGGGGGEGVPKTYVDDAIFAHITSSEPHPAYDDTPSLALLYTAART